VIRQAGAGRACAHCGAWFHPRTAQRFCSRACAYPAARAGRRGSRTTPGACSQHYSKPAWRTPRSCVPPVCPRLAEQAWYATAVAYRARGGGGRRQTKDDDVTTSLDTYQRSKPKARSSRSAPIGRPTIALPYKPCPPPEAR
jgi:hypothetical protein